MSADSRVVACDHIWAVGYGVPAYCMQCGRPQEPDYKSLLAEAESRIVDLQSRLDAVGRLADRLGMALLTDDFDEKKRIYTELRSAALGCESPANDGVGK